MSLFQSFYGNSVLSNPVTRSKLEWHFWYFCFGLHTGEENAWKLGLPHRWVWSCRLSTPSCIVLYCQMRTCGQFFICSIVLEINHFRWFVGFMHPHNGLVIFQQFNWILHRRKILPLCALQWQNNKVYSHTLGYSLPLFSAEWNGFDCLWSGACCAAWI